MDDKLTKYSINWNNFTEHFMEELDIMRYYNDLVDVTLHCDGKKIKAHKMVLSIASPYFHKIFKDHPCKHPIVILNDVIYEDLLSIIKFVYSGHVNICRNQLETFLETAALLQIRGLIENIVKTPDEKDAIENSDDLKKELINKLPFDAEEDLKKKDGEGKRGVKRGPGRPSNRAKQVKLENEEPINENNELNNQILENPSSPQTYFEEIKLSEDELKFRFLNGDIGEPNENGLYRCHICAKEYRHPMSLTLHRDSHLGKTDCPVCHRVFSRQYDMRNHLLRLHRSVAELYLNEQQIQLLNGNGRIRFKHLFKLKTSDLKADIENNYDKLIAANELVAADDDKLDLVSGEQLPNNLENRKQLNDCNKIIDVKCLEKGGFDRTVFGQQNLINQEHCFMNDVIQNHENLASA